MMQKQNVLFAFIRVHSWLIERPLVLTTLALLAIPLYPQNTPATQNAELVRAAKNPYDIARFVDSHQGFDWNVLWKALGTKTLIMQPCGFLSDGRPQCSTELITVLNPDQVILLLQGVSTPADIYLRFLQEKDGSWRFSGAHSAELHNHRRRHEIDRSSGRPFLRVSSQGFRGGMIDSENETWFDLTLPGFEPVFWSMVEGYQARFPYGIGRKISATTSPDPKKDETSSLLTINFLGADDDGEHFLSVEWFTDVYSRAPGAKRFTFQRASANMMGRGPTLPQAEFDALLDLDQGPSDEALIRYIMPRLGEIASGPDDPKKRWLKRFLSKAHDTPEVRELKALLK